MQARTQARKGQVIQTIIGGDTGCINPPSIKYHKVTDERGASGFNDWKTVVETTYDDYKENGVAR